MESEPNTNGYLSQLIQNAIRGNRLDWRNWIEENGALVVRTKRADQGGFELRLQARWDDAFEKLDLLYWLSVDLGVEAKRRRVVAENGDDVLAYVLFRLHAHACLIASEVLALLNSGHASGAMARWRSLHETVVVLLFIKKHGVEVAERYLLHDYARSRKDSNEYHQYNETLGYDPLPPDVQTQVEENYQELRERYGKAYVETDYGWAHKALFGEGRTGRATFRKIEEDVDMAHVRPYYRLAGHSVHANPAALSTQLGSIDPEATMLAGPSNYGLADPGKATAHSLALATVQLLTHWPDVDFLAVSEELLELADFTTESFVDIQSEIEEEEVDKSEPPQDSPTD